MDPPKKILINKTNAAKTNERTTSFKEDSPCGGGEGATFYEGTSQGAETRRVPPCPEVSALKSVMGPRQELTIERSGPRSQAIVQASGRLRRPQASRKGRKKCWRVCLFAGCHVCLLVACLLVCLFVCLFVCSFVCLFGSLELLGLVWFCLVGSVRFVVVV